MKSLSGMDTVMDRLADYFHWNDRQCLEQALWVAQAHTLDWDKIARWAEGEGEIEKFADFRRRAMANRAT